MFRTASSISATAASMLDQMLRRARFSGLVGDTALTYIAYDVGGDLNQTTSSIESLIVGMREGEREFMLFKKRSQLMVGPEIRRMLIWKVSVLSTGELRR